MSLWAGGESSRSFPASSDDRADLAAIPVFALSLKLRSIQSVESCFAHRMKGWH